MFDLFVELMELSPISRSKPRKRESKSRSELSNSGETTASIPADLAISNVFGSVFPLSLIRTKPPVSDILCLLLAIPILGRATVGPAESRDIVSTNIPSNSNSLHLLANSSTLSTLSESITNDPGAILLLTETIRASTSASFNVGRLSMSKTNPEQSTESLPKFPRLWLPIINRSSGFGSFKTMDEPWLVLVSCISIQGLASTTSVPSSRLLFIIADTSGDMWGSFLPVPDAMMPIPVKF